MDTVLEPDEKRPAKKVQIIILVLTITLPILFFSAIRLLSLSGLPVYFMQLALYLVFFLLAFWGLKRESIALPVKAQMLLDAIVFLTLGWLLYALFLSVSGMANLPDEIQTLRSMPAWKIGAQILSAWFFVGMAEELLFRGYVLAIIQRTFSKWKGRRATVVAVLITSLFFSLWHIPVRIFEMAAGETTIAMIMLSMLVIFCYGLGFAYLFIRTRNIILVGLVHGVMNFPLIGSDTQLSVLILFAVIGCVEIFRLLKPKKLERIPQMEDA